MEGDAIVDDAKKYSRMLDATRPLWDGIKAGPMGGDYDRALADHAAGRIGNDEFEQWLVWFRVTHQPSAARVRRWFPKRAS